MEILGRERRRRWTDAEKLEILSSIGVNGETLSRVARRYDVSRAQLYSWRHIFKRRGQLRPSSDVAFLPVDVVAQWPQEAPALGDSIVPSIVELCLMQGRRLRFDSGIDGAILMRLIRAVEGA